MEGEMVRRRINTIAAHFSPSDDISATHLLPMNCSGSLNSVLRRHDNRVYFARQASASLGFFMKQASEEQDNATPYITPKSSSAASECRQPCFAKPAGTESNFCNAMAQGSSFIAAEPPEFARPSRQIQTGDQLPSEKKIQNSEVAGIEWSPRIDVAESEGKFVITVEVPGLRITDIRVEVDDQKLSVKGRRSTSYQRVSDSPNASFSLYHKREIIFYRPYEVVWPLPTGVNKDAISAEFLDGFLHIRIPKY
ncbi:hypothetical protein L6164_031166 [Bauhinia variegata]|uniref:Uncharacterized protein n=1 Tax=Bauhinia variegata TaxID=167791 RepID=A0ACB9LF05_BAUVA|nr:hypothetical protein L6164_031166 [Bauhinia variegata]